MHKQLKLFLGMETFFVMALGMFGLIYAIFVQKIGGGILDVGTAWSIYMIVSGVGIYIMGKFHDIHQRDKLFIILGYLLVSASYLGYYFVSNVTQLFFIQVVIGLSSVICVPAMYSFYSKYVEKGKFASQWAAWDSLYRILQGAMALVGAFLAKVYGFKTLFLSMFLLSLIGLGFATQLKDKNEHRRIC